MPTYPFQSGTDTQFTVDGLLKQPEVISRQLGTLVSRRFVADQLLVQGTPEMVLGGAMRYQRDESIFLGATAESVGLTGGPDPEAAATRADWPRASWSEKIRTTAIQEYGLEAVISNLAIRFNIRPQMTLAQVKLANNIIRFVDGRLFNLLQTDSDVQTFAASAHWDSASTSILSDIALAQEDIETVYNGYNGFENAVLVCHVEERKNLLKNTELRAALPREAFGGATQINTGMVAPFFGLRDILFASQIDKKTAFVIDTSVAGVIADSTPDPAEGFFAYSPPANTQAPIWVKVFKEEPKDTIIAGGRWPAMALISPKAVVKITALTA